MVDLAVASELVTEQIRTAATATIVPATVPEVPLVEVQGKLPLLIMKGFHSDIALVREITPLYLGRISVRALPASPITERVFSQVCCARALYDPFECICSWLCLSIYLTWAAHLSIWHSCPINLQAYPPGLYLLQGQSL